MDKTVWDNSLEKRRSVFSQLDNWGAWSRQGSGTRLYYADHIPGTTPPDRDPPPAVNVDIAEQSEYAISTWCSLTETGKAGAFLLKLKYVERQPIESIATHWERKFKRRTTDARIEALIDEAEWFYWLLTT